MGDQSSPSEKVCRGGGGAEGAGGGRKVEPGEYRVGGREEEGEDGRGGEEGRAPGGPHHQGRTRLQVRS